MASVSFEIFPSRTPEGELRLWETLDRLETLQPSYVSVTCGAGGSDRESTLALLRGLGRRAGLTTAGHLTCVGRASSEVDAEALQYWGAGVRHVVAIRGDMPGMSGSFEPHPSGYTDAVELVAAIRRLAPFEVSVAAYPEPHPESRSAAADHEVLRRKAAAGATRALTQFCFDSDAIVALRDRLDQAGINLKVVPGVLLATDFRAVARMAQRCGASLPAWLRARFVGLDDDLQTRKLVAAIVAAEQVDHLRREGFDEFHFYTLNQADLALAVCRMLDIKPQYEEAHAV